MTLLQLLGLASLVLVVIMTLGAYARNEVVFGTQSRRESIIEVWVNIIIGFVINFAINFLVLPLVNASFTASENFWLGCIYTSVSMVRSYAIRRYFNNGIHTLASRLAERFS